jgi:hemerythrin-like domain-containing protein
MIHYIDTFPERLHHPKEDRYLFQAVRRRDPGAEQVLAELESQHVRGAALIRELERALLEWETQGDAAYAAFAAKVQEFADFHWKHMRQEEDVVMPLAEKILQPEDWVEIDAAFVGNKDPLFDKTVQKDFDKLFSHIVNIAPPPIGLGDAE